MNERIVYPSGDGIAVVIPADCGLSVLEIARKDVPAGLPFIVVDVSDLPADRNYRAAWRADFSEPDGYGGETAPEPEPTPEPEPDTTGLVLDPVLGWVKPEEVPEGR
jgi:hypothetical protein